MSRKGQAPKRKIHADPKFADKTVSKFVNKLMWDGKKGAAEKVFYSSLNIIENKSSDEGLKVFREAMENVKPQVEVRSRRVGGSNYQVPMDVRAERKVALAMRWLIDAARKRGEKSMDQRLAAELMDAKAGRGSAMKKKEDVHKMAEANRAFAHFRW